MFHHLDTPAAPVIVLMLIAVFVCLASTGENKLSRALGVAALVSTLFVTVVATIQINNL